MLLKEILKEFNDPQDDEDYYLSDTRRLTLPDPKTGKPVTLELDMGWIGVKNRGHVYEPSLEYAELKKDVNIGGKVYKKGTDLANPWNNEPAPIDVYKNAKDTEEKIATSIEYMFQDDKNPNDDDKFHIENYEHEIERILTPPMGDDYYEPDDYDSDAGWAPDYDPFGGPRE